MLPSQLDDLTAAWTAKTRQTMRRKAKKLEQEFGDTLEIRRYNDPADADAFLDDIDRVTTSTYQHGLGVAFTSSPTYRERTKLLLERGWFRGIVLYLGGAPAAFWHGELYNGRFRIGTPGFDPQYARHSVGEFLLMRLIEDLCADESAQILDWGSGDADYKVRFGSRRIEEDNVIVYAPKVKPVAINLTRTVLVRTTRAGNPGPRSPRIRARARPSAACRRRCRETAALFAHRFVQRLDHAGDRIEPAPAIREGTDAGQHDAVGGAHLLGIVGHEDGLIVAGLARRALEGFRRRVQIARAVVDDRDRHGRASGCGNRPTISVEAAVRTARVGRQDGAERLPRAPPSRRRNAARRPPDRRHHDTKIFKAAPRQLPAPQARRLDADQQCDQQGDPAAAPSTPRRRSANVTPPTISA